MNKHTIGDLYQMQSLPLSAKIRMTQYRIREWVNIMGMTAFTSVSAAEGQHCFITYRKEMYRNIGAVYVRIPGRNTRRSGEFMKQHENVEIIRPKMNFRQIILKYGYPMIGKKWQAAYMAQGGIWRSWQNGRKIQEVEKSFPITVI